MNNQSLTFRTTEHQVKQVQRLANLYGVGISKMLRAMIQKEIGKMYSDKESNELFVKDVDRILAIYELGASDFIPGAVSEAAAEAMRERQAAIETMANSIDQ